MKNFVNFLAFVFAMFIVGSCEYDDTFIIEEKTLAVIQKGDCYDILQMDGTVQKVVATVCNGHDGQNGQDGQDGEDGKTVMVNYSIVESNECSSGYSLIFTSSLDGTVISSVSFCMPADGQDGEDGKPGVNGLTPLLKTIENSLGVVYLWYFDINFNKIYDEGDIRISENLITNGTNGQDGNPASALTCFTIEYDFQGAGTNYFNSTGYILNGFVLNEGALYLDKSSGSVTLPPFSDNMDLLSLRFNYGSKKPYDLTVKAVYSDNTEETIKTVHLEGNPNFDRNVYATYSQFEYYANLEDIKFKNIKAVKFYGTLSGKCVPEDLFIDQVVICLRDRNVH